MRILTKFKYCINDHRYRCECGSMTKPDDSSNIKDLILRAVSGCPMPAREYHYDMTVAEGLKPNDFIDSLDPSRRPGYDPLIDRKAALDEVNARLSAIRAAHAKPKKMDPPKSTTPDVTE